MHYTTETLLKTIPNYHSFLTLNELDTRAHEVDKKYNFPIKEVGTSEAGHPMYLITTGSGKKNAFIWGFPLLRQALPPVLPDFPLWGFPIAPTTLTGNAPFP